MIVVDQVVFGGVNKLTTWFHALLLCSFWEEFLVLEKNLLLDLHSTPIYILSLTGRTQHKGKQQETQ